jgi:hypothetical protein
MPRTVHDIVDILSVPTQLDQLVGICPLSLVVVCVAPSQERSLDALLCTNFYGHAVVTSLADLRRIIDAALFL